MKVDLRDKPILEDMLEEANILAAIQDDEPKHKRAARLIIESEYINHLAGGDWHKLLQMFDEGCQKRIDDIKAQEQYDVIYKHLYDLRCIANIFLNDMLLYCRIVDDRINQITTFNFICPCCGNELNDEFVDDLRQDRDYREDLANFYANFGELLQTKLMEMRWLAKRKKYDQHSWQKDLKVAMGSRARVEDIEGEKNAVQKALEKNAERRKAGFNFGGE